MKHLKIIVANGFLLLSETSVNAGLVGVGKEGLVEMNCNGHVEVDRRQSQWREEDQHNGNAEPTEKCASDEERHKESSVRPVCNGVDTAGLKKLDTEVEGRGTHSGGVTQRQLPAELELEEEEEELDRRILQEQGEDGSDCQYTTEECLRNGQSAKIGTSGNCKHRFWELFVLAGLHGNAIKAQPCGLYSHH